MAASLHISWRESILWVNVSSWHVSESTGLCLKQRTGQGGSTQTQLVCVCVCVHPVNLFPHPHPHAFTSTHFLQLVPTVNKTELLLLHISTLSEVESITALVRWWLSSPSHDITDRDIIHTTIHTCEGPVDLILHMLGQWCENPWNSNNFYQ